MPAAMEMGHEILERAPVGGAGGTGGVGGLAALPAWFAGLEAGELDRVWVAAVVEGVIAELEESLPHERLEDLLRTYGVRKLCAALDAVRTRMRETAEREHGREIDASCPADGESLPRRRGGGPMARRTKRAAVVDMHLLLTRMLELAPGIDDAVPSTACLPETGIEPGKENRLLWLAGVRRIALRDPRFSWEPRREHGGDYDRMPTHWVRRVAM